MKIPSEIRRGRVTGRGVSLEADSKDGAAIFVAVIQKWCSKSSSQGPQTCVLTGYQEKEISA